MYGKHRKIAQSLAERDLPFHVARHRATPNEDSHVRPITPDFGPWAHNHSSQGAACPSCR